MNPDLSSASETTRIHRLGAAEGSSASTSGLKITIITRGGVRVFCYIVVAAAAAEGHQLQNNNCNLNWGAAIDQHRCPRTTNKLHPHFGRLLISVNEEKDRAAGDTTAAKTSNNDEKAEEEDKFINFTATATSGPELLLSAAITSPTAGGIQCAELSGFNKTHSFVAIDSAAPSSWSSVAYPDHSSNYWISSC